MNNDKTEKKIRKKNNLAFLVSMLAIIALIISLAVVLCVRVALKNKQPSKDGASLAKNTSEEESNRNEASDNTEIISQLEEVQHYLETLESSLKESNSTISTLYKDKAEKEKETGDLEKKIDEMSSKLGITKKEVAELISSLQNNEVNDTGVILENFLNVMKEVNSIRDVLNSTVASMAEQDSANQGKIEELIKSLQNKLDKTGSDNKTDINRIASEITERLKESSQNYSARFDKIDSDLSKVFQSVSNGKAALTSAVADKLIFVPEGDVTFGTISDLIRHIGSDVTNLDEGKILEGTVVFDGQNNRYVPGNIPNHGNQENYDPPCAQSKTYPAGYYPSEWTVDTTSAYRQGYADGYAEKQENTQIEYHYHVHEGTPEEIGGCYGEEQYITGYEKTSYSVPHYFEKEDFDGQGAIHGKCFYCGRTCTADWTGHTGPICCWSTEYIDDPNRPIYGTRIGLICGKTEETLEYATIVFPD